MGSGDIALFSTGSPNDVSTIPIRHIASHARAGETMALRILAAHPNVYVPLQIERFEHPVDRAFVARVRDQELRSLAVGDHYAVARGLGPGSVIIVKQAVWAPQVFDGIVLVRQPLAFVASMLQYNRCEGLSPGASERLRFRNTFERLLRWAAGMDASLQAELAAQQSVVESLAIFYRYRILWLASRNLPIFRYEELVMNPRETIRGMCGSLGIELDEKMMDSHKRWDGRIGHGMNDLSRPVDTDSLDKWRDLPLVDRRCVVRICDECAASVGYAISERSVLLRS